MIIQIIKLVILLYTYSGFHDIGHKGACVSDAICQGCFALPSARAFDLSSPLALADCIERIFKLVLCLVSFKTEHSPSRYNIIVKFIKFEDILVHVDSRPVIGYLLFELLASYGTLNWVHVGFSQSRF